VKQGNDMPTSTPLLRLRSLAPAALHHRIGIPHAGKDVVALVLVFRVKYNNVVVLIMHVTRAPARSYRVCVGLGAAPRARPGAGAPCPPSKLFFPDGGTGSDVLPRLVERHPRRLENKLADLVLLRRLPSVDVLPPELGPAHGAPDVGYRVQARDELAGLGASDGDVDEVGRRGRCVCRGERGRGEEKGAAVSAREALADDLRGKGNVCCAGAAADGVGLCAGDAGPAEEEEETALSGVELVVGVAERGELCEEGSEADGAVWGLGSLGAAEGVGRAREGWDGGLGRGVDLWVKVAAFRTSMAKGDVEGREEVEGEGRALVNRCRHDRPREDSQIANAKHGVRSLVVSRLEAELKY